MAGRRQLPPPSGNLDETAVTVDLTQPIEGDDCIPLSGNSDKTVDWSQPARGDLRDLPVLDPHVWEFLLGTGLHGSGGDKPD